MKRFTRILSLLLAILMVIGLTACGGGDTPSTNAPSNDNPSTPAGSNGTPADGNTGDSGEQSNEPQQATYPLTTEKKTLTIYIRDNSSGVIGDYSRVAGIKAAADKLGVELKFTHPTVGSEADQFNLMIGSGKYPDIIVWEFSSAAMGLAELVDQGILIDMDSYIRQYAPNYLKVLERDPAYPKEVRNDEGKYEAFYTFTVSVPVSSGPVFRKDVLDKYGLALPETVDEWTEVMKAVKEKDPDCEYPLSTSKNYIGRVCFNELLPAYNTRNDFCVGEDGSVVYGPITDNFKAYLTKLNEWYNDGLIDPEFMSNDGTALNGKMGDGTCLVSSLSFNSGIRNITNNVRPTNPDFELAGVAWPVLNKGDASSYVLDGGVAHTGVQAAISSSCEDPVLATQVLDFFYSEEGSDLISWGIEGESYTVAEDGTKSFVDSIMNNPDGKAPTEAVLDYALPMYGFVNAMDNDAYVQLAVNMPEQGAARSLWQSLDQGANLPKLTVAPDKAGDYRTIMNEVQTYTQEMYIKFITGKANFEGDWDTYVNTIKGMGIDFATQAMQDAYTAFQNR